MHPENSRPYNHEMKRSSHITIAVMAFLLLLTFLPTSCRKSTSASQISTADTVGLVDSTNKIIGAINYCYNNNLHDSLVMLVQKCMELSRKLGEWDKYYDAWRKLGEEYTWSGQSDSAIAEAQKMHDHAKARGDEYGLASADYIKGLVYDLQSSNQESARILKEALDKCKDEKHLLKNNIYIYYLIELHTLEDTLQMRTALEQWNQMLTSDFGRSLDEESRQSYNYMYYSALFRYYLLKENTQRAAVAVDSVAKYMEAMGWDAVSRNQIASYRLKLATARGDYKTALKMNDDMMSENDQMDKTAFINLLGDRHELLALNEKWKDAYECLHKWAVMADSIRTAESAEQLNTLNKRFEVDELKMQAEREQMKSRQKQLLLMIAIVAIVVLAVVMYVISRLRTARRMSEMKAAQERMENELRIARDIQMSMVPSRFPNLEGLDMFAAMTTAKEVGGDLYGYVLQGDRLYFAVGDVSGKGVPASLFMAQATRLFMTLANQGMMPAEICTRMNNALSGEDNESGMFVTLFLGLIDLKTGHLDFCNAGHNPPVIGGDAEHGNFLKMLPNAPIGLWPELEYEGEVIDTIKGRPLFIYTDGLNEAENKEKEQFGDDRLLEILRLTHFDTAQQVVETLKAEVDQHRNGAEPNDDLTMMCIRVR